MWGSATHAARTGEMSARSATRHTALVATHYFEAEALALKALEAGDAQLTRVVAALRAAGWEADSETLRWASGCRPGAGPSGAGRITRRSSPPG